MVTDAYDPDCGVDQETWSEAMGVTGPSEIKTIRTEAGLSRKQLAELLGVSWRTVEAWELGRRNMPASTEKLLRLVLAGR